MIHIGVRVKLAENQLSAGSYSTRTPGNVKTISITWRISQGIIFYILPLPIKYV